MKDDLFQTLLYILIAVVGVIGSAYQNQQKKKRAGAGTKVRPMPGDVLSEPHGEFDFGPLLDVFDIPAKPEPREESPESVENGPSVEEGGEMFDSREAAAEMEGLKMAQESIPVDTVPTPESFEEGQSDMQKMAARYEELNRELNKGYDDDAISSGEILSHEETLVREAQIAEKKRFFEPRKAIIYAEILKRKEY